MRTGKRGRPRNRRLIRHYLKQTIAVETRKQLIAAIKIRYGPWNDSPDFVRVLRKLGTAEQSIKQVVADKGYDCERDHEFAHELLGARTVIPVRAADKPGIHIRGHYRRRRRKNFDTKAYHQRVKIETVHSVEKRKMGDIILAKSAGRQHRELVLRAFAYNIGRLESFSLSFIEGFYTYVKGASRILGISSSVLHPSSVVPSGPRTCPDCSGLTDTYPRSQGAA